MTRLTLDVQDCWNRIGIGGDRSCPELVEHIHCRNCPVFMAAAHSLFERAAPSGYLAEWTAALDRDVQKSEADCVSVLLLELGDELLALATSFLIEVTTPRRIHAVPHRSNLLFRGLVNLRGQLQLCVSLHAVLNAEVTPATSRPPNGTAGAEPAGFLVVVGHQTERWAFLADGIVGVERIPRSDLRKVPGTLANPVSSFSQAVFTWRERHAGFLDEERVLAAFRGLLQ
jgi:chemotaxis-related protein WspD